MRPATTRGRALRLVALAAAAIAAVNGLDLPLTARRMKSLAGGEPLLDLRFGYGPGDAHRLLSRLGEEGRSTYLTFLWTVDLILPALFGLALSAAIGAGSLARWRRLALAGAAADYLENVALSALIVGFPDPHPLLAALAAALTAAKFTLYALAAAVAATGMWMARRPTAGRDPATGERT